ncbi:MAG: adenosylcobinamide-GDP ribazoletransferase [Nitrospiraceae bacterium]|nr:adenosylcobinamide-GDP ribazoletransferase [Nitrospiraceae bacterium]
MLRNFITALQFLTIITIKKDQETNESDLARSMAYFPFVGFVIGLLLVWCDRIATQVFPDTISNIFVVLAGVVLTRALHVDGLADSMDGLMGGKDPESRLAIMRDSRIGTAGVLSIVFVLLIKYVSLNNLFSDTKTAALLTSAAFSRWAQMLMMYEASYGREEGMGKAFVGHVRSGGLIAASILTVGISAFVIYQYDTRTAVLAVMIPLAVALFTGLWRWLMVRKTGGVTGDAVGAVSEMNEALTLLAFVFLMSER